MSQDFVIFSNTAEEYEPFIKHDVFYWPRSQATKTEYQRKLEDVFIHEKQGDHVFIVAGARVKNQIKEDSLRQRVTSSPMLTHVAKVEAIYNRPVLGYRYTHGRNPDPNFMLPFDFLEDLKLLDTYMGKPFTIENLAEIDSAIEFGRIIQTLIEEGAIRFVRAFVNSDKKLFIQSNHEDAVIQLVTGLPEVEKGEVGVSNRLVYREFPDRSSLQTIVERCNDAGLDGNALILQLRTWRGSEYMKLRIKEEKFTPLAGKLLEGVSTRLLSAGENTEILLQDIHRIMNIQHSAQNESQGDENMSQAKNTILYGPPGTGKTYSVIEKAVDLVNPAFHETSPTREAYKEEYDRLFERKQIQFCTFHQSFAYEDFVEGLRSNEKGNFVPTDGIFKEMCAAASIGTQSHATYHFNENDINFYKMSLGYIYSDDGIYDYCTENNVIALGYGGDIDYTDCDSHQGVHDKVENEYYGDDEPSSVVSLVNCFKNNLKRDDIVIISGGNKSVRAIARVTGEYYFDDSTEIHYNHFREVEWLYVGAFIPVEQLLTKRFTQRTIYNLRQEYLKIDELKRLLSGEPAEEKKYVLIIDEINRGNISKIFGELITLIEDDKRLGNDNEIKVKLPYSKDEFGVPSNLYLLGTMNTADRSITLMDTALRRRFEFIEMLPQTDILSENIEGINVREMLDTMNKRIEYLYDRDHQIGHAFFINKTKTSELIQVMQHKVLPLLQEYFYEDWQKIELVLGGSDTTGGNDYFIRQEKMIATNLFNITPARMKTQQEKYSFVQDPTVQALLNVYGRV